MKRIPSLLRPSSSSLLRRVSKSSPSPLSLQPLTLSSPSIFSYLSSYSSISNSRNLFSTSSAHHSSSSEAPPIKGRGEENLSRSRNLPDFTEKWGRKPFYLTGAGLTVTSVVLMTSFGASHFSPWLTIPVVAGYWYVGLKDINQSSQAIKRNFPVLGHMRYLLEMVRPEIRQYFIESDQEGNPYSREHRSIIYQRAKGTIDSQPFGTRLDVYQEGYEWINHSIWAKKPDQVDSRVMIGGPHCKQPYSASLLNVSAMSYGALSDNAILALNGGAQRGNFYHNTGEGGISRFHLQPGGDIVWNIGTGYFGCRAKDGSFDPEQFKKNANLENVKMIEIKLSQGAKPAHGGILPAAKITPAIAEARGISLGKDCDSPPTHSAFDSPIGLINFVTRLRELSNGKPVGFKLCVGKPVEIASIVAAMIETGVTPDFITVDGSEGGTGAAPPEFSNRIGMPLTEGLTLVHNLLRGAGLRDRVKIIASGKVVTGFHVVRNIALGADLCNSARAMMFALGCIQSLKCNTNKCPTGITTQDKDLMAGLVVPDKTERVYRYQSKTVHSALEIIGACGFTNPRDLEPAHIWRRTNGVPRPYSDQYPLAELNSLLNGTAHPILQAWWDQGRKVVHNLKAEKK